MNEPTFEPAAPSFVDATVEPSPSEPVLIAREPSRRRERSASLPSSDAPADPRWLAEALEPVEPGSLSALGDALLKAPGRVLASVRRGSGTEVRLAIIAAACLAIAGVVMATFSGGAQLLLVPLKLTLGMAVCAAICLPSLHVFSCLSGAEQSLRETAGALLMGVALMGILLVGFAPVLWVFGQATHSSAVMGGLHLFFFVLSAAFGLSLSLRALTAMNRQPLRAGGLWSLMFVCVLLQMSTTLRPLVGPFDGVLFHERTFFLSHWALALAS